MMESLHATSVRCAAWVSDESASAVCSHPATPGIPSELLRVAFHVRQPEVFAVDTLSPVAALQHPETEILLLPLPGAKGSEGAIAVLADRGTFGEHLGEWGEVSQALALVAERQRVLEAASAECSTLRKRSQEMEALDVLGLAANQTLDPAQVLSLVARFTRTLLGAHYAIVSTYDNGEISECETVGMRGHAPANGADPFACEVVEAGKPIVIGSGGGAMAPGVYPIHEAQAMKVGLGVPLTLFGETFGSLVSPSRRRRSCWWGGRAHPLCRKGWRRTYF